MLIKMPWKNKLYFKKKEIMAIDKICHIKRDNMANNCTTIKKVQERSLQSWSSVTKLDKQLYYLGLCSNVYQETV
jgi:hypothetical protein